MGYQPDDREIQHERELWQKENGQVLTAKGAY